MQFAINALFDKFVLCAIETEKTRNAQAKINRNNGNAELVRGKVLSRLDCAELSNRCGEAGVISESKFEQSANRCG